MAMLFDPGECCNCGCKAYVRVVSSCGVLGAWENARVEVYSDAALTALVDDVLSDAGGYAYFSVPAPGNYYYRLSVDSPRYKPKTGGLYIASCNSSPGTIAPAVADDHICMSNACWLPVSRTLVFRNPFGDDFDLVYQTSGAYAARFFGAGLGSYPGGGANNCPPQSDVPLAVQISPVDRSWGYGWRTQSGCPNADGVGPNAFHAGYATVTSCPPAFSLELTTLLGESLGAVEEPD